MKNIKNTSKNLIALIIGIIIALLLAEILLTIYNPFQFRLKGNEIVLPINIKYSFKNKKIRGVDTFLIHTKNSLGFRGEEKPNDFNKWISIITIGGSTTECFYISDGKDWPALLSKKLKRKFKNIWMNNAGLDGHSTFGHIILLKNYIIKLKPNYAMFLIGCNDVERYDLNDFDEKIIKNTTNWKRLIINKSKVLSLLLNLKRSITAKLMGVSHSSTNLATLDTVNNIEQSLINKTISKQKRFQKSFAKRLKMIINICRENSIIPIFITQPTLVGTGYDDVTNINLGKIKLCSPFGGYVYWKKLEVYNNTTRKVAKEKGILLIDLANLLPKSTKYFYDCVHFTNSGAEKASEILSVKMSKYLSK